MGKTSYVIALGSNRRHGRYGSPDRVIAAALDRIGGGVAHSPVIASRAIGPGGRRYANAVAIIETRHEPPALLARLKAIEHRFGRRRGRRWGPRVIDLDIILWAGGIWTSPGLTIPHPGFRARRFVLDPLSQIAPDWRDPISGLTIRQLRARAIKATSRPRPAGSSRDPAPI